MKAQCRLISGAFPILALLVTVILSSSPGLAQSFADLTSSLAPDLADGVSAAWGDYNNDGYVDLLAGSNLLQNVAGTGGIRQFSSVMTGVDGTWADYDNDGKLDFYHRRLDSVTGGKLYRNTGSGFSSVSFPELPSEVSRGASWADYDNNRYVDLYVGGFEIWGAVPAYYDSVVHNVAGTFIHTNPGDRYNYSPAYGVTSCDWDRDGDQDVYVSNYRLVANRLYQNNGAGFFTDMASTYNTQAGSGHSIGAAWGDFDNDGNFDIFAGNFAHDAGWDPDGPGGVPPLTQRQPESRFLENTIVIPGTPTAFTDRGTGGVAYQESYASPTVGDYDNDGDLDLFFTTVYTGDNPVLYRNDGNWNFTDVTAAEGLAGIGATYQAAWGDYDNDGDLDLVSNGQLFVNNQSDTGSNHWLKVKLTGDGTTVNKAAIGSEVRINAGGQILTRQVEGGTGQGNQNDLTLHFGLGSHSGPVDLEITVAGQTSLIENVSVDGTFEHTVSLGSILSGGEPDPSFNNNAMQVWLRADSGITKDGAGKVSVWQDRSNHGNDATQGAAEIQPTHVTGSFGGRQAVSFPVDSAAQRLDFGTGFDSTFDGSFTMFVLLAPEDGDPNDDSVWFGLVSEDGQDRIVHGIDGNSSPFTANHLYKTDGSSANTIISPSPMPDGEQSEFTLISYVVNAGGMHYAYVNGDPVPAAWVDGSGVINADFVSGISTAFLGSANDGAGFPWPTSADAFEGVIAEFLIYKGALGIADREAVEDYLLTYVPEPGTLAVLAVCGLGFLVHRRRRQGRFGETTRLLSVGR